MEGVRDMARRGLEFVLASVTRVPLAVGSTITHSPLKDNGITAEAFLGQAPFP